MSLVKKPEMTEKKLAAIRRNQKLSHGPVTDEGRERIRAALLRHGFDAPAEEVAMRALGEDPAQFQELLAGLWEEHNPIGASQEGLVIRLARATWLENRADRMQEGLTVRQAQEVSSGRQDRAHAQMMRLKMTEERLRRLAESVECEHYVTTRDDLEKMKNLHQEGVLKDMGEIALALFSELQEPGTGEECMDRNEQQRRVLVRIKEIFGLNSDHPPGVKVPPPSSQPAGSQQGAGATEVGVAPASSRPAGCQQGAGATEVGVASASSRPAGCQQDAGVTEVAPGVSPARADLKVGATQPEKKDARYPKITAAEWEARERPRQLLENILTRQMETCEAQRKAILKESVKGPSPYERAAEIAPTHAHAPLLRRMQDSHFREARRVTNLLLKIKRHEREMEVLE